LKILAGIILVIAIAIAAVLGYAATRPDTFRIERSTSIQAQPEKVFAVLNDFHRWPEWSPWEKMDPAMKRTHSGPPSGKGAVYAWEGNDKVGKGRMEIIESNPATLLVIKLDFLEPWEAHNMAQYTLDRRNGATHITWAMFGPQPYMAKVMSVFLSMDKMVGKDFETGLANLKAVAEN
jgi:uncharacterized protein YndB with AHSA1/START domain